MLNIVSLLAGVVLIVTVLWETFETIVLPRRVTRQFRLTRLFYRLTWTFWTSLANLRRTNKKRDALFSYYGPLSLLFLLATWAVALVLRFALVHYGANSQFAGNGLPSRFGNDLYMSGRLCSRWDWETSRPLRRWPGLSPCWKRESDLAFWL